ncbi:hypothetical protein P8A22_27490 [Streptomyces laculatispora]|uniref:Uncharacterized protein n=1 Tax=Streptomyces laculatispora TaxID=887464 RepID=A0ABY9I9I5_9ACTN|nr:hypothetical protein [Streptomyces laculatispora]WLQ43329.1 hypothetical protein P8A22_27490 [Streptomyces laculatispora]
MSPQSSAEAPGAPPRWSSGVPVSAHARAKQAYVTAHAIAARSAQYGHRCHHTRRGALLVPAAPVMH